MDQSGTNLIQTPRKISKACFLATILKDSSPADNEILRRGREVIHIESHALDLLARSLDESFVAACNLILNCRQRVVVTGMGKSGHIARKVAATMSATHTPALYLHPGEAAHGDLGTLVAGDALVVFSNSGKTAELRPVIAYAKNLGIPIIGIASTKRSLVMDDADVKLVLPSVREACPANVAPTTSTTLQLALGDAIAMAVMDMRGITSEGLRTLHPGGIIGLQLTALRDIMHGYDHLPLVGEQAPMSDAVLQMTSGGFGIAGVVDDSGVLVGVITDGDLRRHFTELGSARAVDVMTSSPKTLSPEMLAREGLFFLNENKITAAFVIDQREGRKPRKPIGVVHVHDFLRLGLD